MIVYLFWYTPSQSQSSEQSVPLRFGDVIAVSTALLLLAADDITNAITLAHLTPNFNYNEHLIKNYPILSSPDALRILRSIRHCTALTHSCHLFKQQMRKRATKNL